MENFAFLDQVSFRRLYCPPGNAKRMKFFVEGVKCTKCISKIESLKNTNPEIQNLEVDLAHQTALVEVWEDKNSFSKVAEQLASLGYKPTPLLPSEDSAELWKQESKRDLIRIGVSAFCAGNIMSLAFATYFGLSGTMKEVFEWTQLFLYLPVVTYVAWPFYVGFYQGIKNKTISIDGPMAIASFLGFGVSTWNLFRGTGSVYFDSLSGFLFLILTTRYLQKKTRFEYLKYLRPTSMAETLKARLKIGKHWKWVRSDQLKKSDVILVNQNDWIPADGILQTHEAVVDLSVLNGESMPRRIAQGFEINAGARLLTDQAEIQVTRSGSETLLGSLLSSIRPGHISETQASKVSDKASQILLVTVLLIATITLAIGSFINFETYFERAFALIILACPCAMAFGTPLAFSFSMRRSSEEGIVVKSARVFEELADIKTVFLDKTGTLTEKFWNLQNSSLKDVPIQLQQIILLLESRSQHPVAFALRQIWEQIPHPKDLQVENLQEIPSLGVRGTINGQDYKFCHFYENEDKWFGLYKNNQLIWKFQLRPTLLPETKKVVSDLQKRGLAVYLLSGDSKGETLDVAKQLKIHPQNIYSELTPQMKKDIVEKTPSSIMVGDGVNDSLALAAARVGVAVKGSVDLALKSADVLLLNDGIESLGKLFEVSKKTRRQIRRNLTAALVYNVIGGVAALVGLVNPFVAALLMPASSVFILVTSWWGTRA